MINLKNNFIKFYILTIVLVFVAIAFLYSLSNKTLQKTYQEITKIEILHAYDFSINIENKIKSLVSGDLYTNLKNKPFLRRKISDILSVISNTQYKYVYLVYKDKKGVFRYLADGSTPISERGEWMQKFDPISNIWQKVIETKKPQYTIQKNIDDLWITYLYPILCEDKLEGILAFDISTKEYDVLKNTIQPIEKLLFILLTLIFFIILFILFQTFIYFKQRKKSIIDPLTQLYNRNYLHEIDSKIDLNRCAIAIADIDNFKKINDTYGHKAGDIVLETIAKRLLNSVRAIDIVIRYGGEEFLIIFNNLNDRRTLIKISNRMLKNISSKPIKINGRDTYITISMGLNPTPSRNKSLSDAIIAADKMLYKAKTNGKNRVEVIDTVENKRDILLIEEIKRSIEKDQIQTFYQPIMDIKSKKIVKYEALVRIVDEDNTIYAPNQFLPIIKETTSYRRLSKIVLSQAFETIKKHNISVSVNFDIDDFFDDSLFEMIQSMIKENSKFANLLTLEILENRQIRDLNKFIKRIGILKCLNIQIAIDDFGSGYSGFNYIATIKPDILKIDGSIILKIETNTNMRKILESISKLCKSLNILTIGEFVENENTFKMLEHFGIDMAQGYFIGKPMTL